MTMILKLLLALVIIVTYGTRYTNAVKPYSDNVVEIDKAAKIIKKNVLSLEGNTKDLSDYSRNYLQIIHAILYYARKLAENPDLQIEYDKNYFKFLNVSAKEALNEPEIVVAEVRRLYNRINKETGKIKKLVNSFTHPNAYIGDVVVEFIVITNAYPYRHQVVVLSSAGSAAKQFNRMNDKFEEVSKDLKAEEYLLQSSKELLSLVFSVGGMYQVLRSPYLLDSSNESILKD